MEKSERAVQARRELDRKFASATLGPVQARPRAGWIGAVRTGLGMSQEALAARLGISTPSVSKLERSEISYTIRLAKLAEVALALDCTLVYALVPNTSLDDTVQKQARRVAAQTLGYVTTTMRLEDQAVESDRHADQLDQYARTVIDSNRLWRSE